MSKLRFEPRSLPRDDLVGDLRDILTFAGVVTAHRVRFHEGKLVALAEGKRRCVVEHVRLHKSCVALVHSLDRHIGLG